MRRIVGKIVFSVFISSYILNIFIDFNILKKFEEEKKICFKNEELLKLMYKWNENLLKGYKIERYFEKNKIKSIAIYGFGFLGRSLYNELSSSTIEIRYGIDRNANNMYENLKMYLPEDDLPEVDAIIVTAIKDFYDINNYFRNRKCI